MKLTFITNKLILLILLIIGVNSLTIAQAQTKKPVDAVLYNEVAVLDSLLFTAFNNRDLEQFKKMFTKDLEFFHDKGGLTGYDETINFLISTTKLNNQLQRKLVDGSLEVYPIPGYGAMEIGEHTFCHVENGQQECGTFKFVQVWKNNNGEWKISRVVSYGH